MRRSFKTLRLCQGGSRTWHLELYLRNHQRGAASTRQSRQKYRRVRVQSEDRPESVLSEFHHPGLFSSQRLEMFCNSEGIVAATLGHQLAGSDLI